MERERLPIRAYVPSGIAILRSVGTSAFPLAGTLTSVALHINYNEVKLRLESHSIRSIAQTQLRIQKCHKQYHRTINASCKIITKLLRRILSRGVKN